MAQIAWTTPAGNLGTYAENVEFSFQLEADNPLTSALVYTVISGSLPPGVQLYRSGLLYGIPNIIDPGEAVARKFKFTVRATNADNQISDRSFTIAINGIAPPTLNTTAESLGTFLDADYVNLRLLYTETNPGTALKWTVSNGTLPPGISLSQTGQLTGFVLAPAAGGPAGSASWDIGRYDEFVWDFEGATLSRTYKFAVRIFDGILSAERYYAITVVAKSFFRTDNALITTDTAIFTSDRDGYQYPTIVTDPTELVDVRADRMYAFQFQAYYPNETTPVYWKIQGSGPAVYDQGAAPNPDDAGNDYTLVTYDEKSFDQSNLSLPPGLILDKETGWLTGTIFPVTLNRSTYTFNLVAYVEIPVSATAVSLRESTVRQYSLNILQDIDNFIVWDTPTDLGSIDNGSISTLSISASSNRGDALTYSLKSGQYSKLPQGLQLLDSGVIAGRTTFDFYSMDRQSTQVTMDDGTTTWDAVYTFTVVAQDSTGFVYDTKDFTVTVRNVNIRPFENLYMKALLPKNLRERFRTTINNPNLVTQDMIYRPQDPYFGLAKEIKFLAIPGLKASSLADYFEAMDLYHRNKKVRFGSLKWAVAKDENLNDKYEVIYMDVLDYNPVSNTAPSESITNYNDRQITDGGESLVSTNTPAEDLGLLFEGVGVAQDFGSVAAPVDATNRNIALSNSFGNMTGEIIDAIGYEYQGALPSWMTTIQPDTGKAIGFVKAVVLAYLNPGEGKKLLFRYSADLTATGFGVNALINQYAFEIDRYQLDRALTVNYDPAAERFNKAIATTFDRIPSIGIVDQGPWTQQVSTTTYNLNGVDYYSGEYIAVGDAATIITSRSGELWSPVSKVIDLGYSAGILTAAPIGANTFNFAYGIDFSLGDELKNVGGVYTSAEKSYITDIDYFIRLSTPVTGYVPSGSVIEFTNFSGGTIGLSTVANTANATSFMSFANISTVDRGFGVQLRGVNNRANVLINNTITNTVQLSAVHTNAIPAGTSITFTNWQGNTETLITSVTAANGTANLTFTTTTANLIVNAVPRMSNIAAGTYVQALNTNVTVTESTLTAMDIGTDLDFVSVITANASIGDSIINLSSTERIGIGSLVFGQSISSSSFLTATWPAYASPTTSMTITIPTADILGITPFVGMRVRGYQLPTNCTVSAVTTSTSDTLIFVEFPSASVVGNPKKSRTANVTTVTGNISTLLGLTSVTSLTLNDYIVSSNISIADRVRVNAIYGNSTVELDTVNPDHVIAAGETVVFQTQASVEFTSPTVVPEGTIVTGKTATSVTLSSPLLSDLYIGYDDNIGFGLGTTNLNYIINIGGTWYAVGSGATVLTRDNNGVWSQSYALPYGDLYSIAYDAGAPVWIIVGNEGLVATSSDFSTWNRLSLGLTVNLRSITFADSQFVAVGDRGTIIYSVDQGATWNINNSVTTRNLKSVKFFNQQWIAVGEKGTVLLSADGANWTAYSSGVTFTLNDVSYINNSYVAVGDRGIILESIDGTVWQQRASNQTNNLISVANESPDPIVVGNNGLVLIESNNYTVDWAVRGISFEMFNFNTLAAMAGLGYPVAVGDTLIFADQEGFNRTLYRGHEYINDGWNNYSELYGDESAELNFDSAPFDAFTVVPGYLANLLDANVTNQRAGVWQVAINENGIAYLQFLRQVQFDQIVTVLSESTKLVYDRTIPPGGTVPTYRRLNSVVNSADAATIFDVNSTKFSSPRDQYLSDPNVYDKYLKFPSTGVLQ